MEIDTKKIKYRVPKEEIVFIDMVIKSYEGLGTVKVDQDNPGEIWIMVTESTEKEVRDIMEDLGKKFKIEKIY
ncbi:MULTISPECIES: DUF4911 domain-containing protein [unclassified Halanaerobium]|uniref:DUF4911 domain-containing protein n=1 Tax=unclassified Halanaerobium TaxID=2641197 RepID=UPI000DF26E05|nr:MULTISPECIES: DUF4911 domain-containing protein [unclassified Halanaerobium]RCW50502.1 uncharacterized protein DUF4911 [Halanaerobium sp. MA284_MarDTE_T2]RCW85989.1 uncharacterized protein DUF4911 [Halanaerobium sp. DL-01]